MSVRVSKVKYESAFKNYSRWLIFGPVFINFGQPVVCQIIVSIVLFQFVLFRVV